MTTGDRRRRFAVALAVCAVLVVAVAGCSVARQESDPCRNPVRDHPRAVRLAVLGDSTRDERAAAGPYMAELRRRLAPAPSGNIVSFGENGVSLAAYTLRPIQDQIRAFEPTAIEISIGINDLRLDQTPERVATFRDDLGAYLDRLHKEFPDAAIVASVPGALSTQDVHGSAYVKVGATVNPAGAAEAVTRELRSAYLDVVRSRGFVRLNDVQRNLTGTSADPSAVPRYLMDQLHPNPETQAKVADAVTARLRAC